MKPIKVKLPCGATLEQIESTYRSIIKLRIVQEDSSFARVFDPSNEEATNSFYRGGLELHVSVDNLRTLRNVINKLILRKKRKSVN